MRSLEANDKGYIQDLTTGEIFYFPRNPSELSYGYSGKYAEHQIPGLSHQRNQFISTYIKPMKFVLKMDGLRDGGALKVGAARSFLQSIVFPRDLDRETGVGASEYLVVFPSCHLVQGTFREVDFVETMWYTDGILRAFECTLEFMPHLKRRTTDKDIRRKKSTSSNAPAKNRQMVNRSRNNIVADMGRFSAEVF